MVLTALTGLFIWPLLYLAVGFAYRTVTIANGSATWGMRFAGIELRDGVGQRASTAAMAALHTAGYTLCRWRCRFLQVISVILMLTSSRGQGLTDHFLGTVMLNRKACVHLIQWYLAPGRGKCTVKPFSTTPLGALGTALLSSFRYDVANHTTCPRETAEEF